MPQTGGAGAPRACVSESHFFEGGLTGAGNVSLPGGIESCIGTLPAATTVLNWTVEIPGETPSP